MQWYIRLPLSRCKVLYLSLIHIFYLAKLENGNLKELSCGKLGMMDMHVHELYLHRTANNLFIGSFEKGVYIYELNSQKILRPEVELTYVNNTRISPLNTKELWVATEGAGFHKLNIYTYETDPAEEKDEFDVELTEVGPNKVKVIKVVREVTGLGLKEAKEVVDGAPKVVKEGASKAEAEEIKTKLEGEGAKVTLK